MQTNEAQRRFRFLREVASGGFGRVFLAELRSADDAFSRLVAIKLLHPKWSDHVEVAARMRDEARLLGRLSHKNIVDVFDLTRIDGRVAVVMEYLEALDLKALVATVRHGGGEIPATVVAMVGAAAASALDAAYNRPPYPGASPMRVIHRDIKPSNLMIDGEGGVKVLDFGGARADIDDREAHTHALAFGSMAYMAPERQFNEPEGPTSDVYSLGATLYELLALERLGKAKVRADEHADHVALALDRLRGRPDLAGDPGQRLIATLRRMLAFEASDRMHAAEALTHLRQVARALRGPDPEEWCEQVIPPLVRQLHARSMAESSDPLVGATITEDRWITAPTTSTAPRLSAPEGDDLLLPSDPADPLLGVPIAQPGPLSPASLDAAPVPGPTSTVWHEPMTDEVPLEGLEEPDEEEPTVLGKALIHPPEPVPSDPPTSSTTAQPPRRWAWAAGGVVVAALALLGLSWALPGPASPGDPGAVSRDDHTLVEPAAPAVAPLPPIPGGAPVDDGGGEVRSTAPGGAPADPPVGPAATFVAADDVQKLNVRCGGSSAQGEHEAALGIAPGDRCLITGIRTLAGGGTERLMARVPEVEARTYRCFEGGKKRCQ